MARPVKDGLDYFPLDVDFPVNPKTEAIMGEFSAKGVLIMVYLLSAVYSNGYYLQWTKLNQMQLANRVGVSPELVSQIVNRLIDYGTFNEDLFNTAKVLTSQRIQETYFEAIKRRKSSKTYKYLINDDNNSASDGVNADINPTSAVVNVDINPQSKVNKTKVNKTKAEKKDTDSRHKYGSYKNVLLTETDFGKLKTEFPNDWQVRLNTLSEYMASSGKHYKNYLATIRNWARRDKERVATGGRKNSFPATNQNDSFSDDDLPF